MRLRPKSTGHLPSLIPALLGLCAACGSTKSSVRVDDGLLVELSHQQMEGVRQARVDRDAARDELAGAMLAKQRSRDGIDIAKRKREVVRAQLKVAALQLEIAQERGTLQDVGAAKGRQSWHGACMQQVEQEIEVGKLERRHADVAFELAEERVKLREAQVILEKARALAGLDSVAVDGVSVQKAEAAVQTRYDKVQELQTRSQAAAAEVREARDRLDALRVSAESLRPASE